MTESTTRSRNEKFRIQDLVSLVRSGQVRIPEFQRSFRWAASDVLALFDSILRGYPFGGTLLWRRDAPAGLLTIGAIEVDAAARSDALWVIDGQQRITSLVNAVDPVASDDERFAISYVLAKRKFALSRDVRDSLAIPLPDLFDLGRAFAWLQKNPDAAEFAEDIQRVTGLLRDVEVPAAVIDEGDERLLREIFDRINSAGKRLRGSEIFDAIHGAADGSGAELSMSAIADRLDRRAEFGLLPDQTIYQAILVIRHPDLTRDIRTEFSGDREAAVTFAADNREDAYRRGEDALFRVAKFLQQSAGIPHSAFVPFRFHLLVLARFFAHFSSPAPRNLELLSRWVWRSTALAAPLGYTGSTANIRTLAHLVQPDDENGSVQRLLHATTGIESIPSPNLDSFRTNNSAGKIIVGALWALAPINPATGVPLTHGELAGTLESETSPRDVVLELLPRTPASNAANRVLAVVDRAEFFERLKPEHWRSHLLNEDTNKAVRQGSNETFLALRRALLEQQVEQFLSEKTGMHLEMTPPLTEFDFDDVVDEEDIVLESVADTP
ncbi:DUF262 domain-containing protein [Rhodococcus triatomae]|uniref:GmrSD restriction endonucleases N-terminal domain-containing protein n=1 Tax=Rhodococcus triatomae TaxID=300028 RepID=A0A1G8A235_9NOCA|nr:DUF262 domain-containing protein [Rhodococcus triatomae]QNG17879.1 DUF262 domain-containing protein [Rhodococcus triatomae]QNG22453.1 DUF262 domain-containing protein [Rhodococcus triatomae]SDH15012.1 Protein of unknown function DUF262 [Rhodococcus triatomae]